MKYIAEFDEYSDTNKFLDELFNEDCAFNWQCATPKDAQNTTCGSPINITDTNQDGYAEETYLKSLIADISEKLMTISGKVNMLPDTQSRDSFFTKGELISRIIGVSNTLDSILTEFGSIETAGSLNTTIISGDIALAAPSMF
jgi:hypothetical protein